MDKSVRVPIVTIHLMGGLGNQLFQYAFGRRLSLVNDATLFIDASGYGMNPSADAESGTRIPSLSHFGIAGAFLEPIEQSGPGGARIKARMKKLWNYVHSAAEKWKPYYLRHAIVEPAENHFQFDSNVYNLRIKGSVSLRGFWQSERYFADIEDVLRKELVVLDDPEPQSAKLAEFIGSVNSIGIHVRHGDNANDVAASLGVLPKAYYDQAISSLSREVTEPQFFVFSDDLSWAKQFLCPNLRVEYVVHNNVWSDYDDLRLLSLCKHHIIANSTFSWWGAWLGKKNSQIVYAPRRYYQNIDRPNPDLYPQGWRLI